MAGGRGNRIRQDGTLVQARINHLPSHDSHFYHEYNSRKISIDPKGRQESKALYQRHVNLLEQDINRLLYSNLDVSHYERFLIELIVNASCLLTDGTSEASQSEPASESLARYMNCRPCGDAPAESLNDKSPSSPEMADSGMESGSLVSPQETVSENSSTDLDEPNEPVRLRKSADADASELGYHSESGRSGEARSTDGILEYERQVLGEPFYESNGDSDTDEQANAYVPSKSFEYTGSSSKNDAASRRDKIVQNGKKPSITIEHNSDVHSSSATSNYYFIDASTLNDDMDIATTNVVGYPNDYNGMLSWSNSQLPSSCYIPSSRSSNYYVNDESYNIANRKTMNMQNRLEEDHDAKLLEHVEPFVEARNIKKLDGPQQQNDLKSCKTTNKESLVVEIKEADSGESAQHSPCPDNTKLDNAQKVHEKLISISPDSQPTQESPDEPQEEGEVEADRRPSLIRRNTFELDANDEKLSSLRQEYERRQGNLVFQNSITQYSQHLIDGEAYFDNPEPVINDDSGLVVDTQASFAPTCAVARDKYDLDVIEKETKSSSRLLLNAHEESEALSMARSSSDKLLANCDMDEDLSFNSLPVNINEELGINQALYKVRRNEAAPIVSGGASSADFQKPTDSPTVRRKTESTPILSGGSIIKPAEPPAKDKFKSKRNNLSSSMTAWVVDMSDCCSSSSSSSAADKHLPNKKSQEPPAVMSASFSSSQVKEEKVREKDKSQHSSLGYFVNLEDIKSPKEPTKQPITNGKHHRRRPSLTPSEKKSCEFFVDLSDNNGPKKPDTSTTPAPSMVSSQPTDSKKNIFSMFIDLSEPTAPRAALGKSSSSSKLSEERHELARTSSVDERPGAKPKSGVFMFIESDSPIVRRRTLSSSRPNFKRHSWNMDKSQEQIPQQAPPSEPVAPRLHRRAHSLSVERGSDFRKLLSHKAVSSKQVEKLEDMPAAQRHEESQELEPKEDVAGFEYDVRDTPPNSHVEVMNEELLSSLKNRNYQELDAIKEQSVKEASVAVTQQEDCSESSVWDKTPTESSDTNRTRKSETFDISSSVSGSSSSNDNLDFKPASVIDTPQQKVSTNHQVNRAQLRSNDISNKTNFLKTAAPTSFVRLSDLDKKPLSSSTTASMLSTKARENAYRLSSSVTETSWIESKLVMSARTNEPLHRTLNKKLPLSIAPGSSKSEHFDEFGNEGDAEAIVPESDLSSLQSSMGRSGQGSTEETETSTSFALGKPYNRLGEDLLRMFLEEINPDVTIDVGGRRIRAHKCILSSRCQYFAAVLSGGWIENAGNIISLQGYSYNTVHFALCHIYSGENVIPDSISIVELATLADMLCLEGLKEVIGFTLKVKYCHLFHKPCNGCVVGVLECMALAAAYGLDEVYRKSLRWVTRHFVRIWPCKEFATLPLELMDKCYNQHIVHMSADNVLQTIMDCDKLLTTLPNVRWAEPVFRLVSNLVDTCMKYLTDNFVAVLSNESFLGMDRELPWNIGRLEDHLLAAAERLPPEQACKSYSKLDKMFSNTHIDDTQRTKPNWSPLFDALMTKIKNQVEKCLIRDAARAARTNAWLKMDLDLRRRIQELACLVILPNEAPNKRPSRQSNFLKETKDRPEPKIPSSRTPPNRNLDLRRVKMAISEHNDRTLKQTPLLQTRKIMNKPRTDPLERKVQNDKLTDESTSVSRPKSWPNKIEVKSRYLEPRNRVSAKESPVQTNQDKTPTQQRRKIMISSSDSSRTSSPAMKRAAEKKGLTKTLKAPMKKDGKALSSDSLTDTRLSLKKEVASKSCGITRPESPNLKVKDIDTGLSIDSLADPKKKPLTKKANKMDTSMSTDSLMTDITAVTTPKSTTTNKSSPILGKASTNQTRGYDRLKKSSPPTQQRNTPSMTRRPVRSLESSTAASRSRAAAVVNTYQGSLNLRKSLLDAAKAPDIPNRATNNAAMTRTNLRQSTQLVRSTFSGLHKSDKHEKKDDSTANSQRSNLSPGSKRSPKSNVTSRLTKSTIVTSKQKNKADDKSSNKNKSQTAGGTDGPKFLHQSSRSGTFLKDEPTILNKSDIETAAIDV